MKRLFSPLLILILLLSACTQTPAQQQFFAMDTVMSITAYGNNAQEAVTASVAKINELEQLLSRTRTASEVTALYLSAPEPVPLSADTLQIISLAQHWHEKTHGAFDITIAPVMAAWGFGSSEGHQIPTDEKLNELLPLVDSSSLILTETSAALPVRGMEIDLGGIAKGYAAGQVDRILRDSGVKSALLDLGGNITVIGSKPDGSPWRIAVRDPFDTGAAAGTLLLQDRSAVTSGGYQRYFEQNGTVYHHIIDPRTDYPANSGLSSVTVVCEDPAIGDILSTALFVAGEEEALTLWRSEDNFDLVLICEDGRILVTQGLAEVFEPAEQTKHLVEYVS